MKLRIAALVALVISVFVSIDFGINFLYSLPAEINDGIGCHSVILAPLFDTGWTRERFLVLFERSLWIVFFVLTLNAILTVSSWKKKNSRK